jgi:hypothetical protein
LWVSFNCFFVSEFYGSAKEKSKRREPSERDYLKLIWTKEEYKNQYKELLETGSFNHKITALYNCISGDNFITHFKGKVADMRPNRQIESMAQAFDDINNFEQFLSVVYQIRCNLFHGNKNPYSDADALLVEAAFNSLLVFLERIYALEGYLADCGA